MPPLIGWLESGTESDALREEAAEVLGEYADRRALVALARAARTDRSSRLRKEAIEAFEHMPLAEATDTLLAFARTLESSTLRHVAVEALGERREPRVLSFLTDIARGGGGRSDRASRGSMRRRRWPQIAS